MSINLLVRALVACALARKAVAQDATFLDSLVTFLNSPGLGANVSTFASLLQQTSWDSTPPSFYTSLIDSTTPKTLFVPNNTAMENPDTNTWMWNWQAQDRNFIEAALSYHLLNGTWHIEDLGTLGNHTIASTNLQGHGVSFLEGDRPQVLACGHDASNLFEIYNQKVPTYVIANATFQHVTIQVVNQVIGMPGSFSSEAGDVAIAQFQNFAHDSGGPSIEAQTGVTLFVPDDSAFNASRDYWSNSSQKDVFNNHIILGKTIWYNTFESDTYTSASGHQYTFKYLPGDDQYYQVTLNGISATITRSDFLLDNGVMHVIDGMFYNITPEATPTATSSITQSPKATGTNKATTAAKSHGLSGGAIAGIVVGIVGGVLVGLLAAFLFWRRRNRSGAEGIYDSPEPYEVVPPDTPITAMSETPKPVMTPTLVDAGPSASENGSQTQPTLNEKAAYRPPNAVEGDLGSPSTSSALLGGNPAQAPIPSSTPAPISDEVVDQLLQRFAARIDRGPAGDSEAPPSYPA